MFVSLKQPDTQRRVATSKTNFLFHSPHSASTASWGCQELEAAATAAWCSNDTTLSHEAVYFLEAALGLREVVSDRGRIGKCFS